MSHQDRGAEAPGLLLMTPGPTRIPQRVLMAGAQPILHHRSPEFSRVLRALLEGIGPVFGTSGDVLPVHTTGRGAMEAAVCNLFCPGDEVVACCNGKFGELWARLAESYGLVVHRVCEDWTRAVDPSEVNAALQAHPSARAVTVVHGDTSTGVKNDVEAVLAVARAHGALGLVDCISALGGIPFEFDAWGVDVAVTASQKCLMASPGLALVAVSERVWPAVERATLPRNYWDLRLIKEFVSKELPQTPGTAPVHVILQLCEAVAMIHEEGLSNVFARHERLGAYARARAGELGLRLQCPRLESYSPALTAIAAPAGVRPEAIRAGMRRHSILVAGGLNQYASTAFRIGHMGDIRQQDLRLTFDALAEVMEELAVEASATKGL